MSLMSMRRKMASKQTATIILWALILVFGVGAVLISMPGRYGGRSSSSGDPTVVAKINGTELTRGDIDAAFSQMEKRADTASQTLTLSTAIEARKAAIEAAFTRVLTVQAAEKVHCNTWSLTWHSTMSDLAGQMADDQLAQMRDQAKQEADKEAKDAKAPAGKKLSADDMFKNYIKYELTSDKSPYSKMADDTTDPTPAAFKDAYVNYWLTGQDANGNMEQFETMARTTLIGETVTKSLHVNPLSAAYVKKLNTQEVQASWIFIADKDDSVQGLKDAQAKADKLRTQVVANPAGFADLAKANSDDEMSKMSNGVLGASMFGGGSGWFQGFADEHNQYEQYMPSPPVIAEYLAFSTDKGQISPVMAVQLPSGGGPAQTGYAFVMVKDIRDRTDLNGYNWNSAKTGALVHAKFRYDDAFGETYVALQRIQANIQRLSTEMTYFQDETSDPATANGLLRALSRDGTLPAVVRAAFRYKLAQTTHDISLYDNELFEFSGTKAPDIYLEVAKLDEKQGKVGDALDNLKSAADNCENRDQSAGSFEDNKLHEDLKAEFVTVMALPTATDLNKQDAAAGVTRMDEWLLKHPKKAQGGAPGSTLSIPVK